eukprot:9209460-Alexandrium_andersonii.AAC.1
MPGPPPAGPLGPTPKQPNPGCKASGLCLLVGGHWGSADPDGRGRPAPDEEAAEPDVEMPVLDVRLAVGEALAPHM